MQEMFTQDNPGLPQFQEFHRAFDIEQNFDADMLRNIAYLTEEVGEVVSAIRVYQKADMATELEEARIDLGDELADCLAYILKLANYGEIDLQAAYLRKMKRNLGRTWSRPSG